MTRVLFARLAHTSNGADPVRDRVPATLQVATPLHFEPNNRRVAKLPGQQRSHSICMFLCVSPADQRRCRSQGSTCFKWQVVSGKWQVASSGCHRGPKDYVVSFTHSCRIRMRNYFDCIATVQNVGGNSPTLVLSRISLRIFVSVFFCR